MTHEVRRFVNPRGRLKPSAQIVRSPITLKLLYLSVHVGSNFYGCIVISKKRVNILVGVTGRETLESVSSCTRFSCILKISNFGFNRSSSKLVGMFIFGIVPMFVLYSKT